MKIILDPGHGKTGNQYPPIPEYYEGSQMWKLANFLKLELEKLGFTVVTTRPKITDDPTLSARGSMAKGADAFISLHSNAGASATDTKPTGSVVYYSVADKAKNKTLADAIGTKVSEIMGHYYRGSMMQELSAGVDYFGVLRAAASVGCKCSILIEHGFHTNVKDANFLTKDANLLTLAKAEAKVISEFFGFNKLTMNMNIVQQKCGFDPSTMAYLAKHPYPDALFEKLANAMK